ncbi:hypothetical protein BV25DRAFT_1823153 [Artomyces pyxidatus]|uniref:Uncharacterized protein n=1 Tax=Artomyces pyxidatus TaxID=48021 RepID=A0ACB8T7T4_9AGAM|nr:hypothetical protein BV25DRAFT_1823153 [Artomyces pyxidatus]
MYSEDAKDIKQEESRPWGPDSPEAYWNETTRLRFVSIDPVASPKGPEYYRDVHQRIDNELAAMHMAMCYAKSRRNAIAPISRLPPEIMSRVFSFCVPDLHAYDTNLEWIKISHVCTRWRTVALNSTNIWSEVYLQWGEEWVGEMLARSKGTPVDIVGSHNAGLTRRKVGDIVKHLPHTRSIEIGNYWDRKTLGDVNAVHQLCLGLHAPAPILESISLTSHEVHMHHPYPLFNNSAPHLRAIYLYNFTGFPWTPCFATNLVQLDIVLNLKFTGDHDMPSPSIDEVLDVLRHSRALEYLVLVRCFGPIRGGRRPGHRIVDLPHLLLCTLGMTSLSDSLHIIKHISIPPSAELRIVLNIDPNIADETFGTVFSSLSERITNTEDMPFYEVIVRYSDDDEHYDEDLEFVISRSSDGLCDTQTRHGLFLSLCTGGTNEPHADLIKSAMRMLPNAMGALFHIGMSMDRDTFRPRTDGTFCVQDWLDAFGSKTDVHTVYTDRNDGTTFCVALGMFMDAEGDGVWRFTEEPDAPATRRYFLPKLSSLTLYEVHFMETVWFYGYELPLYVLFVMCMKARQRANSPLETLHLVSCRAPDADWGWLKALKGVVGSIELSKDGDLDPD